MSLDIALCVVLVHSTHHNWSCGFVVVMRDLTDDEYIHLHFCKWTQGGCKPVKNCSGCGLGYGKSFGVQKYFRGIGYIWNKIEAMKKVATMSEVDFPY